MPTYRADLYGDGARYKRTERLTAASDDRAKATARQLLVQHGADYAVVYVADGLGHICRIATVGADR